MIEHSVELAELVGIIIGDGWLYGNRGQHIIGIAGDPKRDFAYFCYIQQLFLKVFGLKGRITKKGRGLRFIVNSKRVFLFLTEDIGLPWGKGKGERVIIPAVFLRKELVFYVLRGLFDADGTIFTSKKPGCDRYPCIELSTTSEKLAYQVMSILRESGFRVPSVRTLDYTGHPIKDGFLPLHRVALYGQENARLWFALIGFSLPRKQQKLEEIINMGAP